MSDFETIRRGGLNEAEWHELTEARKRITSDREFNIWVAKRFWHHIEAAADKITPDSERLVLKPRGTDLPAR